MKVDLGEYVAYLENRIAAKEQKKSADFAKRMEEYEREQAAEHARSQMQVDASGTLFTREQAEREAREELEERVKAAKRAKAKKYGYREE